MYRFYEKYKTRKYVYYYVHLILILKGHILIIIIYQYNC